MYEAAAQIDDPARVEEDARAVLQRLIDDRDHHIRQRHREAIRALRRALAADMQAPANRKGDLPRALGLVSRVSKTTNVKHRAIILMMDRLLEWSTDDFVFPYDSKRKAAEAVVSGFFEAEIDTRLTAENVEQIWDRQCPPISTNTSITHVS